MIIPNYISFENRMLKSDRMGIISIVSASAVMSIIVNAISAFIGPGILIWCDWYLILMFQQLSYFQLLPIFKEPLRCHFLWNLSQSYLWLHQHKILFTA